MISDRAETIVGSVLVLALGASFAASLKFMEKRLERPEEPPTLVSKRDSVTDGLADRGDIPKKDEIASIPESTKDIPQTDPTAQLSQMTLNELPPPAIEKVEPHKIEPSNQAHKIGSHHHYERSTARWHSENLCDHYGGWKVETNGGRSWHCEYPRGLFR
jgi:hypothetical protein